MDWHKFDYNSIFENTNYLINLCEKICIVKNGKIKLPNVTMEYDYENDIWMIGEQIRQGIFYDKKNKDKRYLEILNEVIQIIKTEKYKRGRESFVMLLHEFKNKSEVINLLKTLLHDTILYGFAIEELNKLKNYENLHEVKEILNTEKKTWIKNIAKRYIKNAGKT